MLNQSLYSAFIQNEFALRENLSLTVGSKLEHNDYTGFEYEPDARLSWTFDSSQALWGAVSRAVRTPSRIDRDLSEGSHLIWLFSKAARILPPRRSLPMRPVTACNGIPSYRVPCPPF